MAGIVSGAMMGLGTGMVEVGRMGAEHVSRSMLQEQAALIARLRDERLAELQEQAAVRADERRRKPAMDAAAEVEKKRGEFVDDPSGTVRQRTRSEMVDVEEGAYRSQGLIDEAQQTRRTEMDRERDNQTTLARNRDDERADRQLELTAQNIDTTQKGAKLDQQIKQITLDNAKRVDDLRKEFKTATTQRQSQIDEELQILTGKDNDHYVPLALKDNDGNTTGYLIFDRKRRRILDPRDEGGGAQPSEADIAGLRQRAGNPAAVEHFERKFGKGSAAKHLPQTKPRHPGDRIVPSQPDRRREEGDGSVYDNVQMPFP